MNAETLANELGTESIVANNLEFSLWGLVAALIGVVLVLFALRAMTWLVTVIPMRQARRKTFRRMGPIVAGLAGVAYSVLAVRFVFRGANLVSHLAALVVIGVVLGLSWFALRDLVAGLFWRGGHACQLGDSIRVRGVEGRVTLLGFRVLGVETEQGDRIFLPYSQLQQEALVVSREQFGESRHVFELQIPTDRPAGEVKRAITKQAMLCHGTSLSRRPRVRRIAVDRMEVTVFALWSAPVADLEYRIRRALHQSTQTPP